MFIYFYMKYNSPDSQRKRGRQSNWGERGCEIEEGKGGGMRERDRRGWRGRHYLPCLGAAVQQIRPCWRLLCIACYLVIIVQRGTTSRV